MKRLLVVIYHFDKLHIRGRNLEVKLEPQYHLLKFYINIIPTTQYETIYMKDLLDLIKALGIGLNEETKPIINNFIEKFNIEKK